MHAVHEVLNLRVQGSIPANRAYNVLYLYKMNRLGQVLGEGCTRMWETILSQEQLRRSAAERFRNAPSDRFIVTE